MPRETNICVGAQSQLDSHMQNHLPSKMDITFKLVLLQMGSWTKWSPKVLSRPIIWWFCDNEFHQYKTWLLVINHKCPAGCYLSASEVEMHQQHQPLLEICFMLLNLESKLAFRRDHSYSFPVRYLRVSNTTPKTCSRLFTMPCPSWMFIYTYIFFSLAAGKWEDIQ